jgi:putative cardiolipin synthase
MPARSRLILIGAIALVALAGCAGLPALPERQSSVARTDIGHTLLARIAEASLRGAEPGESGFRLLSTGGFALDARLALASRAERSLDVQYFQLRGDGVGLRFLRELAAAAAGRAGSLARR